MKDKEWKLHTTECMDSMIDEGWLKPGLFIELEYYDKEKYPYSALSEIFVRIKEISHSVVSTGFFKTKRTPAQCTVELPDGKILPLFDEAYLEAEGKPRYYYDVPVYEYCCVLSYKLRIELLQRAYTEVTSQTLRFGDVRMWAYKDNIELEKAMNNVQERRQKRQKYFKEMETAKKAAELAKMEAEREKADRERRNIKLEDTINDLFKKM